MQKPSSLAASFWGKDDIQAKARAKGHQRDPGTILRARARWAHGAEEEGCTRTLKN